MTQAIVKDDLKDLNSRVDMVALAGQYISLKKMGKLYKGLCPFHSEDTPSFTVYPHTNSFACFGCRAGGQPVHFIRRIENLDFPGAVARLKQLAGGSLLAPAKPIVAQAAPEYLWRDATWQNLAAEQVRKALARMDGIKYRALLQERGLDEDTARHFEVGWVETAWQFRFGTIKLYIPAKTWLLPIRNPDGTLRALKWRHTIEEAAKKFGKYGQLVGSEPGMYNLGPATQGNKVVIATGEFDVMTLWQAGLEAACHTGGEGAKVDWSLFAGAADLVYIADADAPGKKAARLKQGECPLLRVALPDEPYKDVNEQHLNGELDTERVAALLARATIARQRRRLRQIDLAHSQGQPIGTVELEEAREILAQKTSLVFHHPRIAAQDKMLLSAPPGAGKSWAANYEAGKAAEEGRGISGWFAPRHNMFYDHPRDPDWWKQVLGRRAALDADGNPVDFNDPLAVVPGNCTTEGVEYHRTMAEKGWQHRSYEYCRYACPLAQECKEEGYYSQLAADGKNMFLTYAHVPTSLPERFKWIIMDEPKLDDFIEVHEIDDGELGHIATMTANNGMLLIMKALREMLIAPRSEGEERISGERFYQELDSTCRALYRGRGLVELIRQADSAGGWYNYQVFELLSERTLEAAKRLPKNIWSVPGAEPGSGGLYESIRQEALALLAPDLFSQPTGPVVSRVELVKRYKNKSATIKLHRRRYLPEDVVKKPLMVLDATARPELVRQILTSYRNTAPKGAAPVWDKVDPNIYAVGPKVEMPADVRIIQDARHNFSKTSLMQSRGGDMRYWRMYVARVASYLEKGRKILVVCAKDIKKFLVEDLAGQGFTRQAGYYIEFEHYGNLRGSNRYSDFDTLIEAGVYVPQPEAIISAARALYGGEAGELDTRMTWVEKLLVEDGGKGWVSDVLVFPDQRLQTLFEIAREDELLQVAYRLRPLQARGEKKIVLLFGVPVPGLTPRREDFITDEIDPPAPPVRTTATLDALVEASRQLLAADTGKPCFGMEQLIQASGKARATVYKYAEKAVKIAGGELMEFQFIAPFGPKKVVRKMLLAVSSASSRVSINNLIRTRELAGIVPDDWELIELEPGTMALESLPELPRPVIESEEDVPRHLRAEVGYRLLVLAELAVDWEEAHYYGRRETALVIEGQYLAKMAELDGIVARYLPKRLAQRRN